MPERGRFVREPLAQALEGDGACGADVKTERGIRNRS